MKTPIYLIIIIISCLVNVGICQEFPSSGITVGGTNEWYWRMHRVGSGELNESLVFADKRYSNENETTKMILSKQGELNVKSFKTGGFSEWYWKIYRGGSGSLNESLVFSSKRRDTDPDNVKMVLTENGSLGLGTMNPDAKLEVAGNIHVREVKVTATAGGADFVFDESYDLRTLEEIAQFIKENKHLPEIPSAQQMEKEGIELAEMNIKLLQKIEELTLYLIKEHDTNRKLQQEVKELKKKVHLLEYH